jgi:hypothetical protein
MSLVTGEKTNFQFVSDSLFALGAGCHLLRDLRDGSMSLSHWDKFPNNGTHLAAAAETTPRIKEVSG